jgi:hypothetical protein
MKTITLKRKGYMEVVLYHASKQDKHPTGIGFQWWNQGVPAGDNAECPIGTTAGEGSQEFLYYQMTGATKHYTSQSLGGLITLVKRMNKLELQRRYQGLL